MQVPGDLQREEQPTKKEGICDKCGSPVVQREDETEAASAIVSRRTTRKPRHSLAFMRRKACLYA